MNADTAPDAPARPGRQRSEAADHSILTATLDLLATDGYGGLTMAAVIARAGVSSATLYRRWAAKHDLVTAAVATLQQEIEPIDTGSLPGDIGAYVRAVADTFTTSRTDVSEQVAVALRNSPEFSSAIHKRFVLPRLAQLDRIIEQARDRGELGPGISATTASSFVSGPLHHRANVVREPLSPAFLRSTTVAAVAALVALAPPR